MHLAPQTRRDLATSLVIAALVYIAAANPSEALTFSFRCPPDCPESDGAGRFLESEFRFDDSSLDFSWTALFEQVDGRLPDGFWLVVSEGRARNQSEDGLAILYGDGATGRVSAYVYDRERKRDSFSDPALFIDTFPGALVFTDQPAGRRLLELTLNAGTINSFSSDPGWRGLAFDEDIGIWAHASVGTEIPFASDGRVLDFSKIDDTSFDRGNRQAAVIPEPDTGLLLAAGLTVLGWRTRLSKRTLSSSS